MAEVGKMESRGCISFLWFNFLSVKTMIKSNRHMKACTLIYSFREVRVHHGGVSWQQVAEGSHLHSLAESEAESIMAGGGVAACAGAGS